MGLSKAEKSARAKAILAKVESLSELPLIEKGLIAASRLHEGQVRKGTKIPYISHLMSVAGLVQEADADEGLTVAALLHDAVEDQEADFNDIRRVFGDRVAKAVEGCTAVADEDYVDADADKSAASSARKRLYLEHLKEETNIDVLRVSLADKLHNATAILRDFRTIGDEVWKRFNVPKDDQLRYYQELAEVFESKGLDNRQVRELGGVVDNLVTEAT